MEFWNIVLLLINIIFISVFVIRMILNRRKMVNSSINLPKLDSDKDEINTVLEQSLKRSPAKEITIPSQIIFGPTDNPDIKISVYDEDLLKDFDKITLNTKYSNTLKLHLENLLSHIPNAAFKADMMMKNAYLVSFSNTALSTGKFMESGNLVKATIVGSNGRVLDQGALVSTVSTMNPLTISLIVWQVAAIITAQKFLSDINNNLELISDQIKELKQLMNDQYISDLFGNYELMNEYFNALVNSNFSIDAIERIDKKIEDIEQSNLKYISFYRKQFKIKVNDIKNINPKSKVFSNNIDDNFEKLKNLIEDYFYNCQSLLSAFQIRSLSIRLNSFNAKNKSITDLRLNKLIDEIDTFENDFVEDLEVIESKIEDLEGVISGTKEAFYKEHLNYLVFRNYHHLQIKKESLDTLVVNVKDQIDEMSFSDKRVKLIAELDEQKKLKNIQIIE